MFGRTGKSGNDGLRKEEEEEQRGGGFFFIFSNTVKLPDNDDKGEVMRIVVSNHWQEFR